MRFYWLILLCLLCSVVRVQSQTITGRVVRNDNKSAVANANVFLSNSSYGTSTSFDGTFTLNNVKPGQYTFVVSHLGYADYIVTILVANEPIKLNIDLVPKSIVLRGVTITTKADWKRNFELFKKEFIGTDDNAKYCEIKNPEILDFTYYSTQKTLLASADKFLVVDNRALGYRVKFLIDSFKVDGINGIVYLQGQRLFEDLPGSKAEKKKWKINRDSSYYGSAMHFYRSLYQDRLFEEGFEMHRYVRYINQLRPPDGVIMRNLDRFRLINRPDSFNKWVDLERQSKYSHEVLYPEPSFVSQVLHKTDRPGIFAFTFPDCMYIIYKKKQENTFYKDIYHPLNMPNYQTTVLTFMNRENYALFDMNGIIVGGGPLYEGTWSKDRLSQLLPVDYQADPEGGPPVKSIMLK